MIKQHSDILIRALRPSRFGAPCLRAFFLALAAVTVALTGTGLPAQAQAQNQNQDQAQEQDQAQATAPRNLRAQIVDGGVALRWNAPTEDAASVDGYEILRRRPNRGEETLRTLVPHTGNADTAYTDATATKFGVRYAYRVKAIRGGERSPESDYATVLVPSPPTLVSNLGQSPTATATITQQYAMNFRLGKHGQGYEISNVTIDLAAVPSDLTVSLWRGSHPDHERTGPVQRKVFDFTNPPSLTVGLNEFTAPPGAFAYQNVNYAIVLSGFDTSLSIRETTSDDEDPGGETGATLENGSIVRGLSATGRWSSSTYRGSVLRLAVEGSRRDRGILAASYAQPIQGQEIISVGDDYWISTSQSERRTATSSAAFLWRWTIHHITAALASRSTLTGSSA